MPVTRTIQTDKSAAMGQITICNRIMSQYVPQNADEVNAIISIHNEAVNLYNGDVNEPLSPSERATRINQLTCIIHQYDLDQEAQNFVANCLADLL